MVMPTVRAGHLRGVWSRALLLSGVVVVVLFAIGCQATSGSSASGDDWSRSFVLPYDRVWTAVVRSLSSSGYILDEQDPGQGRIRAESVADPAYRAVVLDVRVDQRGETVRVDVQASGGGVGSPGEIGILDRAVTEFLEELDELLGHS
jgi:hypothetical protein